MTHQETEEMKQLVLARIQELEASLVFLKEETKIIPPSCSLGRLTRMDAIGTKAVNEHVLSRNRTTLVRLQNALARFEKGTYGKCLKCGKEIPMSRLRQVPEAFMCVPCSDKRPQP